MAQKKVELEARNQVSIEPEQPGREINSQQPSLAEIERLDQIQVLERFRQEARMSELEKEARKNRGKAESIQKRLDRFQAIENDIEATRQQKGIGLRGFLGVDNPAAYLQDARDGARESFITDFGIEPDPVLVASQVESYNQALLQIEQELITMPDMAVYEQERERLRELARAAYGAGERFKEEKQAPDLGENYQTLTMAEEIKLKEAQKAFREEVDIEIRKKRERERERGREQGYSR